MYFYEAGANLVLAGRKQEALRLRDKPVGARELKRAKDYVTGQLRLSLESTTHQLIWLGEIF